MSSKPTDKSSSRKQKSPVDMAGDLARQIWLAGVGAYGQAVDDTQEKVTRRVAKVTEETSKFFEELVTRGTDFEQKLGAIGKLSADVRAEGLKRGADMSLSLDDRLSRMRDMLGLNPAGGGLEAKVDQLALDVASLSGKLDTLVAALGQDEKSAAKKTWASDIEKTTFKSAGKSAGKGAVLPKKAIVKKSTTKKPDDGTKIAAAAKKPVRRKPASKISSDRA